MSLQEADNTMNIEGSPSVRQWLRESTSSLLADLGLTTSSATSSPITMPRIIFNMSSSPDVPSDGDIFVLLEALSHLAAVGGVAELILNRFRPLALDLLARWLENSSNVEFELWERRLCVIAAFCVAPDLWSVAVAFIHLSPFRTSPLAVLPADLPAVPAERLHPLLLAYLRLLTADPHIAGRSDWPNGSLHVLRTQHPDMGVRLLAIQILAVQRGWSEEKRMQMEKDWIGDMVEVDAVVMYGYEVVKLDIGFELRAKSVDGWMLPVLESRRIAKLLDSQSESIPSLGSLADHLAPRSVLLADSLLLRSSSSTPIHHLVHVPTATADAAIRRMAPLLQLGHPILLTSPSSSGKTHLLQYLSTLLHPLQQPTNRILTIPLADTTIDVKGLLGTYVSSPTKPGTFEWMEGALAKAVRAGRWVVFDDIDRGSMEMLVTIAGITRSLKPGRSGRRAKLAVPGRGEIEAGDGFALFATRTSRQDATSPPIFFGHHRFIEVTLDSPTDDEILAILSARFAQLPRSLTAILVDIWRRLRPLAKSGGQGKARDIGLRDLEKWCARVQRNLPPAASLAALESGTGHLAHPVFQDEILLEAADTFMASLDSKQSSADKRSRMIATVAQEIGMDEERARALLDARKPALEIASRHLLIGRTMTPIAPSDRREQAGSRPFALTKPSLILLERIAAAVSMNEPTLLVGETGTGKTTAVQYIATSCHKPLTVLNLSMQTESSDLLGGFKPIDASVSARALHAKWQKLFLETFSMAKAQNGAYLEAASKALSARKWGRCADLWASSARRAVDKLTKQDNDESDKQEQEPRKRRKVNTKATKAAIKWQALLVEVADFDLHHVKMNSKLVFSFIEGPLVKAMRSGEWLLLDEVNLASQETLEAIATILEGPSASLVLTERGDVEPVTRHPNFRLFACMNPATDVGKKDLPPSLRSRFTELYVPPPDDDREALVNIVAQYIGDAAAGDKATILDVVEIYSTLKRLSNAREIVDGSNAAPHYSMRTLARALTFAVETAPLFGLRRGLWEGCLMAFTMSLDQSSAHRAHEVCERYLLGPMKNARAVLAQIPSLPSSADADDFVRFGPFWLRRGPLPPVGESRYVITPSVQAKLSDLARVILTHRYPVLIQGPTSAGKTSAVEFLARQTGHRFVRINNHEHTDIQEYLGTYITDTQTGNLVFQEGLLVTAVRQGHWIVLDELNLAPTDVLEALNRLLDDNRELVIPETQEVIKPHPNFILFATQNPPGLYAGRKVLSRAFRNRFLEVHFDDVPKDELETILCQRCQIAPSYAKRIVRVFEELRHRRQASRVFESKQSFATLRDLFRWAERGAVGYQQLAEDGYMLLAERGRQDEDKAVIKQVIEDVMKVKIDEVMYRLDLPNSILSRLPFASVPSSTMVWTRAMQRLFALVAAALAHNEPVLLVGETGCGKTSICEVVAEAFNQRLVGVNCHQNMETADLLGSQRPVRNRHERKVKIINALSAFALVSPTATEEDLSQLCEELASAPNVDVQVVLTCQRELQQLSALFEWSDGPLVHAMTAGELLLIDEVSLADDSVLERLNSVLEPGRTLVLAEKGGVDIDAATLIAHPAFHVVATMNPGGDFGKKELSPALRNRFTEIWVPPLNDKEDLLQIIGQSWKHKELQPCGPLMLVFLDWFGGRAWVNFANFIFGHGVLSEAEAFHHGGQMVIVDGLESLPQVAGLSGSSVVFLRQDCLQERSALASSLPGGRFELQAIDLTVKMTRDEVRIGGFGVKRGSLATDASHFRFEAPSTALNAMRVLRGCQLPKAILLEGSPGVGKTSLVSALAAISGHRLQRINLSDQTDLIDLFGSDLPIEGGQAGEFQWRDAAFLDAMQKGDWVLLDEMNLASQTVLEGLNAVLDHRGTVFISELGRSFVRHPDFRVFAAQNPLQQGGGRKGLPKSFLNRFTKVYLQEHTAEDLLLICRALHPMPVELVETMIAFNEQIRRETMVTRTIGREGSPWEFNLRDLFRWFKLLSTPNGLELSSHPIEYLRMVYLQRFRNDRDREAVLQIFTDIFAIPIDFVRPAPYITPGWFQVGHSLVSRSDTTTADLTIAHVHLELAESVLKSVEMGWLVILAGDSGGGKRSLIRAIAEGAGRTLGEFAMHPGVDTSELLGSFEQQDVGRLSDHAFAAILSLVEQASEQDTAAASLREPLRKARSDLADPRHVGALDAFVQTGQQVLNSLTGHVDVSAAIPILEAVVKAGPNAVGFAWVDGQLLDAIRSGGWFLISNANLCSASVLDRLNSLCETSGVLVMSEKGSSTGSPEVIKPHPDFRLFLTYDPRQGELSRAMRNRGVELYVQPAQSRPIPILTQTSPGIANHASLRSLEALDTVQRNGPSQTSAIANTVASSTVQSTSLISRFGSLEQDRAEIFKISVTTAMSLSSFRQVPSLVQDSQPSFNLVLPIDISLGVNVSITEADVVFRAIQLVLRNHVRGLDVQRWLADPTNNMSILAASAAAVGRAPSRGKPKAGLGLYPFTSLVRGTISQMLTVLLGSGESTIARIDLLEHVLVFVTLLEEHAKTTTFDYSATQLLSTWLQKMLQTFPTMAREQEKLQGLAQAVSITRGLGQAEVWSVFREAVAVSDSTLVGQMLELGEKMTDPIIRFSVLQAIAASHARGTSESDLLDLRTMLEGLAESSKAPTLCDAEAHPISSRWTNWPIVSVLELSALYDLGFELPDDRVQRLLLQEKHVDLRSLIDLEVCRRAETRTPAATFRAITTWLQRSWDHADLDAETLTGSAEMFKPAQLSAALRFGLGDMVRLSELEESDQALQFCVESVLLSASKSVDRSKAASTLAVTCLSVILSAFGFSSGQAEGVRDLVALLQQSFGSLPRWLSDTFKRHLDPFIVPDVEHTPTSTTVGSMWLSLAALLIELYVTDVPIDPAVRRVLLGEVFFTRIELLEEELAVVELSEVSIKGVSDSKRREKLLQRIANVDAERQGLGPTVDRPTDVSRLALFFAEVHSFLRDIASESAIAQLARALAHNERHALDRERAFQLATAAFIQRLTATYTDLEDLARPIVTALLFARFGMRCLARGAEARESKPDQTLIASLAFPPITAAVQLQELHVRSEGGGSGSVRSHFLAALAHAREVNTAEQRSAHIPALAAELDHLYSNWSDARVRENQEAQAAESLCRVKKTDVDVLPEHEQEEKEFAELFPQYEKVTDWDAAAVDTASKTDNQVAGFGASDIAVFHSLVSSVFGERAQHCTLKAFGRAIEQLVSSTFDPAAYTEALDRSSIAYQVAQLHHRQTEIKTAAAAPNFYLNPNEAEVRKAYALVARMIAHLSLLIDQWPEQMVLQHIRDRCDRFLALDARSPVAKILSALEQLLVHADDWEAYASRENSLKGFQSEVSALIVEWRRLELASWMRLLDDQYEQYVATDAEWTLRLYGVLIHDALLAENIDKHIESVLPMMATYLQSSTLGHFGPRLALLTSFELMARELARSLPASSAALSKMATMLHNTAANARLFLGRIEDSLQTQRSVLDEAIKDFVKLASWKDINIYALKASAVKSHRQLLRSIRKFREILQQPIAPVLSDLVSIVPQDEPQVAKIQKSPVFAPASHSQAALDKRQQSAPSPPDHLVRLRDTYSRFSRINQDAIQRVSADATGPSLDTMAVDIIETVEALAKATPSTFTKENATVVNNLASRKRKAFADLLKALRTAGFSQNVRADQLGRQRSVPWLAQLQAPAIADVPEYRHDLDRIESYHYRSAILMRALRAAFNGHNPDISSHDLQRGIGFTESVYASALSERDNMTAKLSHLKALENITARIRHCASSGTLYGVRNLLDSLVEAELTICRIQEALKETEEAIRRHRELQGIQIKANDLTALHNARSEIALLIGALSQVCSAARSSGCGIFTQNDFELLSTVAAFRRRLHDALEAQATTSPELSYLLLPVAAMTEMSSSEVATSRSELSPDLWVKSDNLIQVMLVVIQGLAQTSLVNNVDEDVGVHVPSAYSQLRTFAQSLRIPDIVAELSSFLAGLSDYLAQFGHSADAPLCLARILPFVESLSETYAQSVATHIFIVKSTYKLCYVVGRLMLDLAHRGFCKPSEESDSGKDGDEGDKVEGTGMGAGSGDKNVSSEIEEEGQVEGLQGEKEEEGEADEKEDGVDDDAVEMENDFEGALGDGKEREGEDDEGEDEGEEDEHDDHIGDVDPLDPGAVDEKFWGDEEQPEKENGKELMDQGTHEAPGEAEMSAKENERKESKNDKREQEAAEGSEQQQDDTQHDDTPQDELGDDDGEDMPDDSNDRDDNDADEHPARQDQSEVNVPEGDRLDLPEDLYLGSENGNDLDDDLEDDMDLPNDETGEGDDAEGMQDVDMGSEKGGEAAEDAPPATDVTEEGSAEQEDLSQNLDLSASNDAQAQESADVGQGQSGSTEKSDQRPMPENDDVPMDEAEKLVQDNQPQGEGAAPNQPQQGSSVEQPEGDGPVDSSGAPIPSAAESQPQASRSLGDILQEIRRRRDEIFAQQEREQPTQDRSQAQAEASGQVEYLQDDDQDEDMQALGPAGDEERQKLEDLNIVDDDAEADTQAEHSMHDADQAERPSTAQNQKPHDIAQQEVPRDAQGAEKALTQAEVQGQHSGPSAPEHMEIDGVEEGFEVKEEIKVEAEESDAELHVVDQPLDALTKGKGEDQWRQYASLTSDLSYALCEQLRLILEPTLATRLQGDFRTGKRLNMRKIIPYIASEYTKDKIWLRRTKPSRREYQVLLSLDDSRSMAESHSVNLAYQTLALVAQALNKLEVGQVSIAKFGESVDILHPFGDAGFTDADGAKVMSSFTFDQQCTNVAALVERTLTFLAEARQKQSSSTTAPDMWQLQIIISDGVCQDHHKLRTLLRRALEERVMIVFIIVDSLHQNTPSSSTDPASTRPSILSMQTVEYKHVHGTMQLEMTRYLDTFPFEFFVVLRDVEALPGVLADTLRQWMARVSQSQE